MVTTKSATKTNRTNTTKKSVLAKNAPMDIVLADGKTYTIPALSMNTLADMEDEFGCDISELEQKFNERKISSMRSVLYVLMKGTYPELSVRDVGGLVPLDKMDEILRPVLTAMNDVIGGTSGSTTG